MLVLVADLAAGTCREAEPLENTQDGTAISVGMACIMSAELAMHVCLQQRVLSTMKVTALACFNSSHVHPTEESTFACLARDRQHSLDQPNTRLQNLSAQFPAFALQPNTPVEA